jgi:hypothetical protein
MKEIILSSGALLKIGDIPFETSNNLKKALMREIKGIKVESSKQMIDLYKDYLCAAFSSEDVERCLWECMKRCLYNGLKIDKDTFESSQARIDFTDVQIEVGIDCLIPFSKPLFAGLQRMLAIGGENIPVSK